MSVSLYFVLLLSTVKNHRLFIFTKYHWYLRSSPIRFSRSKRIDPEILWCRESRLIRTGICMQWIRKNRNINRNGFFKVSRFSICWAELFVVCCCYTARVCVQNFCHLSFEFFENWFHSKELWAQNNNSKNWLIKLRLDVVRGMVSAFHMSIQSKYPLKLKLIEDETWSAAWSNRFRF